MRIVIGDGGYFTWKMITADGKEHSFHHIMYQLTESQWQDVVKRSHGNPPPDYVRVNGIPYVIGERAESYGVISRRSGAARYAKDYYGVFVGAALAQLYESGGDVIWFGSHPPAMVDYADDLINAALGKYVIEIGSKQLSFRVVMANTFEEPRGGLMNVALNKDGTERKNSELSRGKTLVIDIGGFTTDWLAVYAGGEPDYSLHDSSEIGIGQVLEDFEASFRKNNKKFTKSSFQLPPELVREAVRTGVFRGAGTEINCEQEVAEATNKLLNRIQNDYQKKAGGPLPYASIILTGGGSAMLYDRLLPILEHDHVVLADNTSSIHMANVRGGLKLWRLYEQLGLVEL